LRTGAVGILLTVRALGALAGAPLGGVCADRFGIRATVLAGLAAAAATTVGLIFLHGLAAGVVVLASYGLAGSVLAAGLGALLGAVASPQERSRAFGVQYALGNVGGAGGAATAAVVLSAWPAGGYIVLYAWDALSFVVMALIIWRWIADGAIRRPSRDARTPVSGAGYRELAGDRALSWLCLIAALVVAGGYCQLHVGLPALAAARGIPAAGLGWVFTANMVTVVACQLPVMRWSATWRRTTSITVATVVMAAAWALVQAAPGAGLAGLVGAGAVFALGEAVLAPVLGAVVNDLAGPELRGRYNGAVTLAWTTGWLAGTVLAGSLVATGRAETLFPVLVALLALAAIATPRLGRALPAAVNRPGAAARGSTT
jgi:MFS family permease